MSWPFGQPRLVRIFLVSLPAPSLFSSRLHKDSVFLCILCDTGEIIERVFGVLTFQLRGMRRLMQSYSVTEVTMESTSVYWIPIWRVLEPYFHLRLVNPYFIKQMPGRKSDVKDAQWIAECTFKELIPVCKLTDNTDGYGNQSTASSSKRKVQILFFIPLGF